MGKWSHLDKTKGFSGFEVTGQLLRCWGGVSKATHGKYGIAMPNLGGLGTAVVPTKTPFGIHAKALVPTVAQRGMCRVLLTTVSVMAED